MKKSYNSETINAYLLGTLPEAEAEILDELSFTDDAFADELQAAEKDLVDAFVNDELRGTTLERFKTFYLSSPLRREKVEFARSFQKFAEEKLQNEFFPKNENLNEPEISSKQKMPWWNIFTNPRPPLQLGFAVLILFLMGLAAWLVLENSRLKTQFGEIEARRIELQEREKTLQKDLAEKQASDLQKEKELAEIRAEIARLDNELKQKNVAEKQSRENKSEVADSKKQTPESRQPKIVSLIIPPQLRGNDRLPTLKLSPKTDFALINLELESDDYPFYQAVLKDQSDGRVLWQSGKIKARKNTKILSVKLSSELLKAQTYSLEVSGISPTGASEIISDYSFRVVR